MGSNGLLIRPSFRCEGISKMEECQGKRTKIDYHWHINRKLMKAFGKAARWKQGNRVSPSTRKRALTHVRPQKTDRFSGRTPL
jgi:hypothetical protein